MATGPPNLLDIVTGLPTLPPGGAPQMAKKKKPAPPEPQKKPKKNSVSLTEKFKNDKDALDKQFTNDVIGREHIRSFQSTQGRPKFSFSGSDCKSYFYIDKKYLDNSEKLSGTRTDTFGFTLEPIEGLSTVSVQVYEPVGRVRALGHKGVMGFTHSIREIAGSLIFTVVNDHPLRALLNKIALPNFKAKGPRRSKDSNFGVGSFDVDEFQGVDNRTRIGTLIPQFGIYLQYKSEYLSNRDQTFDLKLADPIDQKTMDVFSTGYEQYTGNLKKEEVEWQDTLSGLFGGGKKKYNKLVKASNDNGRDQEGIFDELSGDPGNFDKKYRAQLQNARQGAVNQTLYDITHKDSRDYEAAGMLIDGIQLISEGIVTSVNDMVTEVTYQFIAQDLKTLSKYNDIDAILYNQNNKQVIEDMLKDPDFQMAKQLHELADAQAKSLSTTMKKYKDGKDEFNYTPDGSVYIKQKKENGKVVNQIVIEAGTSIEPKPKKKGWFGR